MKSLLILTIFLWSAYGQAFGLIHDVEKTGDDRFEVQWTSCSAFPTIGFVAHAINSTDIVVDFLADESSSCIRPEALSETSKAFYTLDELFQSAGIDRLESSRVFISW